MRLSPPLLSLCFVAFSCAALFSSAALAQDGPVRVEHGTNPIPRHLYINPAHEDFRALVSSDLGLHITKGEDTWFWVCEDIIGYDVQTFTIAGEDNDDPFARRWIAGGIGLTQDDNPQYVSGIYTSTDKGCNWTPATGVLEDQWARVLSTDPEEQERVLIATQHDTLDNGVAFSTDGGETWAWSSLQGSKGIVRSLIRAQANPKVVYATVVRRVAGDEIPRELYRSEDGGETWTSILSADTTEPPLTAVATDILEVHATDPVDPLKVYFSATSPQGRDLYVSSDGGESYTKILSANTQEFSAMVALPSSEAVSGQRLVVGNIFGEVYMSDDLGETWTEEYFGDSIACLERNLFKEESIFLCSNSFNQFVPPTYSLAETSDDLSTINPLFHYRDIAGHMECPEDSQVNQVCIFLDNVEAGDDVGDTDDVGSDGGDTGDVGVDVGADASDTPPHTSDPGSCECAHPNTPIPKTPYTGLLFLFGLFALRRRYTTR